jgi:anaerobic selenocysteine-containing dehydrogenase
MKLIVVDLPGEPDSRPDLVDRYPLVLACAKPALFLQSQLRCLPGPRKRQTDPKVMIHREAAKARAIAPGEWVIIETPEGRMRARARLNGELDPRVAVGEHGWWQACVAVWAPGYDPFGPDGANFNRLISHTQVDPVSGTPSVRATLCQISRVA